MPRDKNMPVINVRLLKMPRIKKTASAVSVVASIRAKSSGLIVTMPAQNEIQP